ncbi:immunity 49 family protein [Streptomyces sp. NPDC006314]|uniref:immunity 49 family protein n=1 Tax=Streptomyces sp. NPDC006314 TaxID=3154475 RepID=UPI0033B3464E
MEGTDPEPAAQRALQQDEKAKGWGFAMPPAVLLSQLLEGDEESFKLALADALEAHRDYYQVPDRADDPDASVNLDILALACHARRRGWDIRVRQHRTGWDSRRDRTGSSARRRPTSPWCPSAACMTRTRASGPTCCSAPPSRSTCASTSSLHGSRVSHR